MVAIRRLSNVASDILENTNRLKITLAFLFTLVNHPNKDGMILPEYTVNIKKKRVKNKIKTFLKGLLLTYKYFHCSCQLRTLEPAASPTVMLKIVARKNSHREQP